MREARSGSGGHRRQRRLFGTDSLPERAAVAQSLGAPPGEYDEVAAGLVVGVHVLAVGRRPELEAIAGVKRVCGAAF